jgi:uncharacterized membrane protein YjjP (DUF1212 family)
MLDVREANLTLDLSLRLGEVLLSSGAGAADVVATMTSVARQYGLRNPEIDVTFTSFSMSYVNTPEDSPLTHTRQINHRAIDYEHLTQVDHLVRDVLAGQLDVHQARTALARITSTGHVTPRWAITIGWGLMCSGIGLMLGGDVRVVAIAFVAAVVIDRLQLRMSGRRLPFFYQQVAGGAVATLIAAAARATGLDVDPSLVVTANIVMLLAGVGFMGGLQDALSGFYVTAGARLTEAVLATTGIIAGVSGGLSVASVAGVEIGRLDPGTSDLKGLGVMAAGGALAAAAFAFSSYAPKRILAPIGLIAAVAMVISQGIARQDLGTVWPVAIAAFFVGLVSYGVSVRLRVPALVVVVSAVVPMLPGLSIYRGLALLAEGEATTTSNGLLAMITAASIAIALASGVILGEYVAQPLQREAHRLESRLSGPRLVGPVRLPGRSRRTR